MNNIIYVTADKSLEVKLVYNARRRFHNYRGFGKSWPVHTQCLCFVNGLLVGFGEVVKHEKDIDSPKFAFKEATKRVISKVNLKSIRKELWKMVLAELEAL